MAGYEEQLKIIQDFGATHVDERVKRANASGNQEVSEEDATVEDGLYDAMRILELENENGDDNYQSDFSMMKNFQRLLDSTGRKTKESSKIYPVASAMEDFNEPGYMQRLGIKADKDMVMDYAKDVVDKIKDTRDKCEAYLDSVNPWTTSGKKRKALVTALKIQLNSAYTSITTKTNGLFMYTMLRFQKEGHAGESLTDLIKYGAEEAETRFADDIINMKDNERADLKTQIMAQYGLNEAEADDLFSHRDDISQADAFFGGTGSVNVALIDKLASQYRVKKEGFREKNAMQMEADSLTIHQDAANEAFDECQKLYGINARTVLNTSTIIRVITSLMDTSGTKEAKEKNVGLVKSYCDTHTQSEGFYSNLIDNYLSADMSLFENRNVEYIVANFEKISNACGVGTEMLANILSNYKKETGYEVTGDALANIQALANFHMDYAMYSTYVYNLTTVEGGLYVDRDVMGNFNNILQQMFGPMNEENGGIDERTSDYQSMASNTLSNMSGLNNYDLESKRWAESFINTRMYKFATTNESTKNLLVNVYGWKDIPLDTLKKQKAKKVEDIKA